MSRVEILVTASRLVPEAIFPRLAQASDGGPAPIPFDKHLERARRSAAASAPFSTPPASSNPATLPSRPETPRTNPDDDGRAAQPDDAAPVPSEDRYPVPEATEEGDDTPRADRSRRDEDNVTDAPTDPMAAPQTAPAQQAAEANDSAIPVSTAEVKELIDAANLAPAQDQIDRSASDQERMVVRPATDASEDVQENSDGAHTPKQAGLLLREEETTESRAGSEAQDSLSLDAETSVAEERDQAASRQAAPRDEAPAESRSTGDIFQASPPPVVLPPSGETADRASLPLGKNPDEQSTADRPPEIRVSKPDGRRGTRGSGPANDSLPDSQPGVETVSRDGPIQSATAEISVAELQPLVGQVESASSAKGSDQPSDAKTADAPIARGASAQASDPVGPKGEATPHLDQSERARFVQRVARAFESAMDRGGHVRLRLHPPELGSLQLDLTVRDGHMTARLETDTEAARNVLLDNLPALKERLTAHQIRVERLDIEWRGQTPGGMPDRSGDPGRWQGPPSNRVGRASAISSSPGVQPDETAAPRPHPQTSFDVVI